MNVIETEGRVTVAAERWAVVTTPDVPGACYIAPVQHSDVLLDHHAVVYCAEGVRLERAKLMAAAPQMYEALEAALIEIEQGPPYHESAIAAMRAALAAARGEATDV